MEHTFWTALDKLVEQSEIIIDRPKGSVHPVHPDFIYQVDYGFLRNYICLFDYLFISS